MPKERFKSRYCRYIHVQNDAHAGRATPINPEIRVGSSAGPRLGRRYGLRVGPRAAGESRVPNRVGCFKRARAAGAMLAEWITWPASRSPSRRTVAAEFRRRDFFYMRSCEKVSVPSLLRPGPVPAPGPGRGCNSLPRGSAWQNRGGLYSGLRVLGPRPPATRSLVRACRPGPSPA